MKPPARIMTARASRSPLAGHPRREGGGWNQYHVYEAGAALSRIARTQAQRAVGPLKIDQVRIMLSGNWQYGHYCVGAAALQQFDTAVDMLRAAQRIGRLKETDTIEEIPPLLQPSHGMLDNRQGWGVVPRKFRGTQEGNFDTALPP